MRLQQFEVTRPDGSSLVFSRYVTAYRKRLRSAELRELLGSLLDPTRTGSKPFPKGSTIRALPEKFERSPKVFDPKTGEMVLVSRMFKQVDGVYVPRVSP